MKSNKNSEAVPVTAEQMQAARAFFCRAKDIAHAAKDKARRVKAELKQAKQAAKHAKKAAKAAKAALAKLEKAVQKTEAKAAKQKRKTAKSATNPKAQPKAVQSAKTAGSALATKPLSPEKTKVAPKAASAKVPSRPVSTAKQKPGSISVPRDWEAGSKPAAAGTEASEADALAKGSLGQSHRQRRAAGNGGVVPQSGDSDFHAGHRARHGVLLHGLEDDPQHLLAQGLNDPTPKHNRFGVQQVGEVRQRQTRVTCGIFDHRLGQLIPAQKSLPQVAAPEPLQVRQDLGQNGFLTPIDGGLDPLDHGGATGQRLETAAASTAALGAVHLEDHVSNLTGGVRGAAVEFPIQNEAAANPRANEDAQHAAGFVLQLSRLHPQHRHVAVILDPHGHPQQLLEGFLERYFVPAQVWGKNNLTQGGLHCPRHPQPNRTQLVHGQVSLIHRVPHATGHPLQHRARAALRLGGDLGCPPQAQNRIKQAGQDLGPAKIHSHHVTKFVV